MAYPPEVRDEIVKSALTLREQGVSWFDAANGLREKGFKGSGYSLSTFVKKHGGVAAAMPAPKIKRRRRRKVVEVQAPTLPNFSELVVQVEASVNLEVKTRFNLALDTAIESLQQLRIK